MTNLQRSIGVLFLFSAAAGMAPSSQASCGASLCSVNTQWESQGAWTGQGLRLNLHYAYSGQEQLRSGSRKAPAQGAADTTDELRTRNSDLYTTLDYAIDADWAVSLQVPFLRRKHGHVVNDVISTYEDWNITELGDMRLLFRRRISTTQDASSGIHFGLKLPSGKFHEGNQAGAAAERSLQPGSGTTDTVLGAYTYRRLEGDATTAFVQGQWQRPVDEREHYAPGQQVSVDAGLRYAMTLNTSAMLQLNLLWKDRDQGQEAEPEDTGGRYVYLSPGINHSLTKHLQLYGFVQWPLYQHVRGIQLTADRSVVVGLSWK